MSGTSTLTEKKQRKIINTEQEEENKVKKGNPYNAQAQGTFCMRLLHLFSLHGFRQPEVSRMNPPSTRADC
jgi:hypothetical protein